MKKTIVNQKVIFVAIMVLAVLYAQKSLSHIEWNWKLGKHVTGPVEIKNMTGYEDTYTYIQSEPFDVIQNETEVPVSVVIHNSRTTCPAIEMTVGSQELQEVSNKICNPKNRNNIDVTWGRKISAKRKEKDNIEKNTFEYPLDTATISDVGRVIIISKNGTIQIMTGPDSINRTNDKNGVSHPDTKTYIFGDKPIFNENKVEFFGS